MSLKINKYIKALPIFILLIGCVGFQDEDLFDASSAQRVEENRDSIFKDLETSSEGWLLQYFPHPDQIYGGINYYLKFKDGKVSAKIEGEKGEETSPYQLISRGGSVLSFNQYNSLLHRYANPSGDEPKGKQGDFEFLILSKKDDAYTLKGLRTGNYYKLLKLTESADSVDTKILKIKNTSLDGLIFNATSNLEGEVFKNSKKISFKTNEGILSRAYVYTPQGIKLYKPITIDGVSYEEFLWDESKKSYTAVGAHSSIFQVIQPPIDFSKKWTLVIDPKKQDACQEIKDLQDRIQSEILTQYPGVFLFNQYDFGTFTGHMQGLRFDIVDANTFTIYGATYNLSFKGVIGGENALQITPNFAYTEKDGSYWEYFPSLNVILEKFVSNSPYVVTKIDESRRKLSSKNNPEFWFILGPPSDE